MTNKEELLNNFQYVVLLVKDYLETLPQSSKIAVSNQAQVSLSMIEEYITTGSVAAVIPDPPSE